jgi:hypothetical protein
MDTLFLKNAQADTSRKFLDVLADPKLAVVIYKTWWHYDFLQRAKEKKRHGQRRRIKTMSNWMLRGHWSACSAKCY